MPGTIMEINCAVGDKVTRGQAVLVLEEMKMNNDIVAPCDGTILQIIAQGRLGQLGRRPGRDRLIFAGGGRGAALPALPRNLSITGRTH